ncbi:hypothetical protein TNCV_583891 [Trichonephila clavipes]|nr:hypothetical protein TNCV_583891 [Trichonephila clavipes]
MSSRETQVIRSVAKYRKKFSWIIIDAELQMWWDCTGHLAMILIMIHIAVYIALTQHVSNPGLRSILVFILENDHTDVISVGKLSIQKGILQYI